MTDYEALLEPFWQLSPYELSQADKERELLLVLSALDQHHRQHCPEYARIAGLGFCDGPYPSLSDLPYLAVRLFKHMPLKSIAEQDVYKLLQSSGTSGQAPSRIFLDQSTSKRQSRALVKILQNVLGKARLPMLIIDSPAVLKDRNLFSARGAGIQGLAFFGREHTYALDEQMQPNWPVIDEFVQKHGRGPVLLFGFTFMVWLHLLESLHEANKTLNLPQGVLLHSGGWKKLEAQKVDNSLFKQRVKQLTGVSQVVNFYGMAEQVGSVFVECKQGHLHAPLFADVLVRNPYDLTVSPVGESGLLQVLSVLPSSYPGHSLLTEDMGTIHGVDDCPCGRKGKYFSVSGRLPKSEVRGCSDTHSGARL
ncbi:acyl-protein synthetase [Bowmanella denitrificans]|uniref:Acyl-protein synthetase n=1 Tax=Bowmanella denitrificans TaxID=366582 RepID=A0ABN0XL17_9ALTE